MTRNPTYEELAQRVRQLGQESARFKQTEEALRKGQESYRPIIENMEEGYHEVDIRGNFTFFNESMRQIMGYETEELLGMNNRQYADEENSRKVYEVYNRVYQTGESVKSFEWQIIRKDGDRRNIDVSISLIKDPAGHPTGFRGIVRDITARKQAEEKLREGESKYRSIMENISDGLLIHDFRGQIMDVNETICRLLGYTREELMGESLFLIDSEENKRLLPQRMERLISEGTILFEGQHVRKDGSLLAVEVSAKIVKGEGAGIVQGFVRDITNRKRAEEEREKLESQLRQAQKMESIGTLAGGIAHDFNNIPSPLMMHTEMAMMDAPPNSPVRENLRQIYKAAERARDLVRQILTFARKSDGGRVQVRASLIVAEAIKFLRSSIPTTISLQYDCRTKEDTVFADPTQLN